MTILLVLAACLVGFIALVGFALCRSAARGDRMVERAREDTTRRREQEDATVTRLYPRAVRTDVTLVPPDSDDAA